MTEGRHLDRSELGINAQHDESPSQNGAQRSESQRSVPNPGHPVHGRESLKGISTTVLEKNIASGKDALDILFDAAAQEKETPKSTADTVPSNMLLSHLQPLFNSCSENDVRKIWSGCRFVKGGWLTAHEAVTLIDLFFQNMAPRSPIVTDFFSSHHTHYWLLTQEPVLCCTMLMISSRYHTLPGPSGASRASFIHYRLWQHCQHLILRIVLGQEKLSKAKTRHLGTIEALLLLSEWYPRALHFPPESDGWDSDLMYTVPTQRDPPPTEERPMRDRWWEDVVEPTRRLDRMSWMLVSTALALAHELGVFDSSDCVGLTNSYASGIGAGDYIQHLTLRRKRIPWLLYVISGMISFRLGCTSLIPSNFEMPSLDSILPIDSQWANLMLFWAELTTLTQNIREKSLPRNRRDDRRHIDFENIEYWKTQLAMWKENHQETGDAHYDNIIQVEYEYLRVFANSLGVQGIVERVLLDTRPQGTIDSTFVSRARQINFSRNEYDYIEEVIDGACAILTRIVLLSQSMEIQFLPSRIFLRMINSSIFLLKALALGVRRSKLQESLRLLDQAIDALKSGQLEDVHLVSAYASLLETHVSRLRQTFISCDQAEEETDQSAQDAQWDSSMRDWCNHIHHPDWLSLPLDPLMAPFGSWNNVPMDLGLGWESSDLDFIWNLPP
ncbi:C6 transcription factor [Aspergillus sclerotialis]|uniref:C6 transcription factor n=1 Tax=Aspergillus sclerotialis TaxID=2070753 RepID=A0A3A2ZD48_9EURO|nr:C6 transcription factor [Aspergillus sclerotialis]